MTDALPYSTIRPAFVWALTDPTFVLLWAHLRCQEDLKDSEACAASVFGPKGKFTANEWELLRITRKRMREML